VCTRGSGDTEVAPTLAEVGAGAGAACAAVVVVVVVVVVTVVVVVAAGAAPQPPLPQLVPHVQLTQVQFTQVHPFEAASHRRMEPSVQ